jgi:hypothetical protein
LGKGADMSFDLVVQDFFCPRAKILNDVLEKSRVHEQTLRKMNAR